MPRALAALALLVGCGRIGFGDRPATPPPDAGAPIVPAPDLYTSGTRLRAEYLAVGGARAFATWFDTQRGEPCAAATAEDGSLRCLPSALSTGYQFSDATCTTPLVVGITPVDKTDCPAADALARQTVNGRTRIVQVGAPYTGTVYQANGDGTCAVPGSADLAFYVVGATVPAASFVAIHEEQTRSGDLAYIEQVGDDGSRLLVVDQLVVAATGVRGQLVPISHDAMALAPSYPYGGALFADAACTEPAVFVSGPAPDGHALIERIHDTCTDAYDDATLGAEVATAYQHDASGACIAATLASTQRIYRTTSLAPLVPLATAALDASDGSGLARWQFAQGQTLPAGFYDAAHGDLCEPISLVDGPTRVCAPIWDGHPALYSDATCATAINGYPRCRGAWRATWYPDAFARYACEGILWTVYGYDQPLAGPYYERVEDACALADPTLVAPLGPSPSQLPTSEMASVTRGMD